MAPVLSRWLIISLLSLSVTAGQLRADDAALAKELEQLNTLTGSTVLLAALEKLSANPDHARKLLAFAVPGAKDQALTYQGALVLGRVAIVVKDLPKAELFLRVCVKQAASLQSPRLLKQAYGPLLDGYFAARDYRKTVALCREWLELKTNDGKDRLVIGTTSDNFGGVDFDEPREGFATAESVRGDLGAMLVRATARLGDYERALQLVDELAKQPLGWSKFELKGWVLTEAGRLQDAVKTYQEALEDIRESQRLNLQQQAAYRARYRHLLSGAYADLHDVDKATRQLEALLKIDPNDPRYYLDLGLLWAEHRVKLDAAEKLLEQALALARAQSKAKVDGARALGLYLDGLAWVYHRQQKHRQAKALLVQATEDRSAQRLATFAHLAEVCLALGDMVGAIAAWQQGLTHADDSRRDRELQALVEKKLATAKGK